jgi:ATPase subunit of ABC transporter with duplicated ATPase domains
MSHKPIIISDIFLSINQKTFFEKFSTQIHPRKHIVIMGRNGAGKSILLKIIQGIVQPTEGYVTISDEIVFGYVPQTISDYPELSGGQRFNKALSSALSIEPDILCLDEPTNHLDLNNKRSLIRMLQKYNRTLIIISHDPEILTLDFDEIWHIEHGHIKVFQGNYSEYLKEHGIKQQSVEHQREQLRKEKRQLRKLVQVEHKRASQSKSANKNENDRNLLGAMKESGSHTAGKNLKRLSKVQEEIQEKLAGNFVHKKIEPKFNLDSRKLLSGKSIVSIVNGGCGYKKPVINNINLQVKADARIAIIGDNGTGKSTFIKALLHDPNVITDGQWIMPQKNNIGYLDQHYSNLDQNLTVTEIIQKAAPDWDDLKIRKHLNDFLFSTQEEVKNKVANLSGGEKARLSLAQIAAQSPYLLLLDEITNNVDLETREQIIEVLKKYPGAMIIVTHDPRLLQELSVDTIYETQNGSLCLLTSCIPLGFRFAKG